MGKSYVVYMTEGEMGILFGSLVTEAEHHVEELALCPIEQMRFHVFHLEMIKGMMVKLIDVDPSYGETVDMEELFKPIEEELRDGKE